MSADLDLTAVEWIKSSYSDANGGQCVEFSRTFAQTHGVVPVRDSKVPHGPTLSFPAEGWASFVAAAEWIKSSYSDANGGQCVEFSRTFAQTHGVVPVRDSKDPHGPALIFPAEGWVSFVSALTEM